MRCVKGAAWSVLLPSDIKVFAPALVAARPIAANEPVTEADLRSAAAALAASGEWGTALIELFRAMIRSLSERVVIEEFAGHGLLERTATHLRLTPRGRLLSNELFQRLLPEPVG